MHYRKEKDSLGEMNVPRNVYFGIQTARAVENFPISRLKPHPEFIKAYGILKKAAALTNMEAGILDPKTGEAIIKAAEEIINGEFLEYFVVDVFQAGAGTSFHMNVNEVIANRAAELLGGEKGDYKIVHPNDHVNMSQSTNDTFPTAMRIALLFMLRNFIPVLDILKQAFYMKAEEFDGIIKSGRTHLQDAVPIRPGQEFKAYGQVIKRAGENISGSFSQLLELGIGGTAAGTGINTLTGYRDTIITHLKKLTGFEFKKTEDLRELMQSDFAFSDISSRLKNLALELIRIANDLRLLSSGPSTGCHEINLPPVQLGSSIMPGKVNPVMAEVLNMVCFQVVGNDSAISMAVQAGQLELNVMMPVIVFNLIQSIEILRNVISVFTEKCVQDITANRESCEKYAFSSDGFATILNTVIGYEKVSEIAKESVQTKKSIPELIIEKGILSKEKLDEIMDIYNITETD